MPTSRFVPKNLSRREKPLRARDFLGLGGGKAASVAFLARRFGAPATLIGRVGDDDLAKQALQPLRESGVDISEVTAAAGTPTALSMITVPPSGEKSIVLAGNANDA
ncbi:putative ribokinase [Aurantimonas sp. 22II-16-19i]|nr:PfkB family carbohydrate kinase [Aurantimonas sp. 22II-16-19i]ORE90717.1 putative ribokinase [Aurantimonas sp. 22II-16-19i]